MNRDEYQARWIYAQGWLSVDILKEGLRRLKPEGGDLCAELVRAGLLDADQGRAARLAAGHFLAEKFQTQETMRASDTQETVITARPWAAMASSSDVEDTVITRRPGSESSPELPPHRDATPRSPARRDAVAREAGLSTESLGLTIPGQNRIIPPSLQQRYEVLEEINRGSMGAIVRARRRDTGEVVALKFMLASNPDEVERARFQREAEVLIRFKHPHIVNIMDVGVDDDLIYFAMELIEGRDLRSIVDASLSRRGRSVPLEQILSALLGVAEALEYVHELGVVHRDIKPQNILVTPDLSRAVLVDFGLMKRRSATGEASTASSVGLTNPDDVVGTPAYMSPEQLTPGAEFGDVGPSSDVWGFGATLFYCASGLPPFNQATVVEVFQALATQEAPRLRALAPDAPAWLDELCAACLRKAGPRRPAMREVRRWLQRELDDDPPTSFEDPPPATPPWAWLGLGAAALALLLLLLWWTWG